MTNDEYNKKFEDIAKRIGYAILSIGCCLLECQEVDRQFREDNRRQEEEKKCEG